MSWHFTHDNGVTISSHLKGQLCVCPFHINMAKHDLHSINVFALQMTHLEICAGTWLIQFISENVDSLAHPTQSSSSVQSVY